MKLPEPLEASEYPESVVQLARSTAKGGSSMPPLKSHLSQASREAIHGSVCSVKVRLTGLMIRWWTTAPPPLPGSKRALAALKGKTRRHAQTPGPQAPTGPYAEKCPRKSRTNSGGFLLLAPCLRYDHFCEATQVPHFGPALSQPLRRHSAPSASRAPSRPPGAKPMAALGRKPTKVGWV